MQAFRSVPGCQTCMCKRDTKRHFLLSKKMAFTSNAFFLMPTCTFNNPLRTKSLYKVFLCCQSHAILSFMKRIESLLEIAGMKFDF